MIRLQDAVDSIQVEPSLIDYLMEIVRRTRETAAFTLGVSPRGSVALFRAARAYAMTRGRDYLVPDDIRDVVVPCLAHRLLPSGMNAATLDAHERSAALLSALLDEVEVPV